MRTQRPVTQVARRKWLLGLIRAFGTSNAEFARTVGINGSAFNLMTTGQRPISDRSVYRVVRVLNVAVPKGMEPPAEIPKEVDVAEIKQTIASLSHQIAELQLMLRSRKRASEVA